MVLRRFKPENAVEALLSSGNSPGLWATRRDIKDRAISVQVLAEHVLLVGPMATVSVLAVGALSGGVRGRFGSASSSFGDLNSGAKTNC
jgi:hypothetical protein